MTIENPPEPATEELEIVSPSDSVPRVPIWREAIKLVRDLRAFEPENMVKNGPWGL